MSSSWFTKFDDMVKINKVSLIKVQSGILTTTAPIGCDFAKAMEDSDIIWLRGAFRRERYPMDIQSISNRCLIQRSLDLYRMSV